MAVGQHATHRETFRQLSTLSSRQTSNANELQTNFDQTNLNEKLHLSVKRSSTNFLWSPSKSSKIYQLKLESLRLFSKSVESYEKVWKVLKHLLKRRLLFALSPLKGNHFKNLWLYLETGEQRAVNNRFSIFNYSHCYSSVVLASSAGSVVLPTVSDSSTVCVINFGYFSSKSSQLRRPPVSFPTHNGNQRDLLAVCVSGMVNDVDSRRSPERMIDFSSWGALIVVDIRDSPEKIY